MQLACPVLRRSPRAELLESRYSPAVFVVANFNDSGTGSLRKAVSDANASIGADTITFQESVVGKALALTSGHLNVTDALTISGPTNGVLTISGNSQSRVFNSSAPLTITDLELVGGTGFAQPTVDFGAVILSTAPLTIQRCLVGYSFATKSGAGIYHTGSTLTIENCGFYGCTATGTSGSLGGAIYASGSVVVTSSIFQGNYATGSLSGGGGIYLSSGTLTLDGCGFQGNGELSRQNSQGGNVKASGPVLATNCTFDNGTARDGGGLYLTAGGTLWNCTVAYNSASTSGKGGGIFGDVILESTIVSNNTASSGPDIFGAVTAKNCALGKSSGFASYTDQGGNLAFGLDPRFVFNLSGNNGGNVLTIALLADSPCKNKGSNPGGFADDERGAGFPRLVGSAPDIGAFEIQPPPRVTVQIGQGEPQRSRITNLTVSFDERFIATTSGISKTFTMNRPSDNAVVTLSTGGLIVADASRTYTVQFTGGPVQAGSLADGVYRFTVNASMITDVSGQNLDGNNDGVGGDDFVSPTTGPNRIFRLFGDSDGDGDVDLTDFAAFRAAIGTGPSIFDFDNDGDSDISDFVAFRGRFGMVLP